MADKGGTADALEAALGLRAEDWEVSSLSAPIFLPAGDALLGASCAGLQPSVRLATRSPCGLSSLCRCDRTIWGARKQGRPGSCWPRRECSLGLPRPRRRGQPVRAVVSGSLAASSRQQQPPACAAKLQEAKDRAHAPRCQRQVPGVCGLYPA